MKTHLKFGSEAKQKMLDGVRKLSDAVTTTLGPRGQNVAIAYADPSGRPYLSTVIHDGVSVAKSIELEDDFEKMGADLLKQAAQKQVQICGDGTTVSILLARAILEEANMLVAAGINPMGLKSKINNDVEKINKEIERLSTPVTTLEQKKYIANISAEDETLGNLVATTIDEMGVDGLVAVEESKNNLTTVDKQEGMQLDKGWYHELFITNPERRDAVIEDPYILITDKDVLSLSPILPLLNEMSKNGHRLFIITPNLGREALESLLNAKIKGLMLSLAVQAPSFGNNQKNILQDLAFLTGARFITSDTGCKLEDIKIEDLGRADYIMASKTETIIVGGKGDKTELEKRIKGLNKLIKDEESDFDREKLKERMAKLTSGVAVIKVGGATEVEMLERLERVKDAVAATKAAITSGIVAGGETVYLKAREVLDKDSLLYKVLYEPFKKLVNNAGMNDGQLYERILNSKLKNAGVDVNDGEIKDMIKSGIIDPSMVPMSALTNASSVGIAIMTTGCVIIPFKDETNTKTT